MERQTKTITTPVGKIEVVLYEWLTGGEKRALTSIFLKDVDIETRGTTPKFTGLKGSIVEEAENLAIETIVVSIGGNKENKLEGVLAMHARDYQFIVDAINKITNDTDFTQKKTD